MKLKEKNERVSCKREIKKTVKQTEMNFYEISFLMKFIIKTKQNTKLNSSYITKHVC